MSEWSDVDSDEERFAREFGGSLGRLRARGSQCPKPDLVLAQQAGLLPAAMAGDVAAHVENCPLCQALARDLQEESTGPSGEESRRIYARVFAADPPPLRQAARGSWTWLWHPAPALAALALAVGATLWLSRDAIAPSLSPPHPAAPAPAARPSAAAPALPLEKPPVRVALADALVWRGEGGRRHRYLEELGQALQPYRGDDFAGAAMRLDALSRTDPTPDVFFYLGVSRLFLGRPADAVTSLEQSARLADPSLAADISWYLAVAYERAGRIDDARAELRKVCGYEDGERRAAACRALDRVPAQGR